MHPMTLTEKRMVRIWQKAELAGTDHAWYDTSYALHNIAEAVHAAAEELQHEALDQHADAWRFLSGMALQRALIANHEAKTVQMEVAA